MGLVGILNWVLVTGMLYSFTIIIETIIVVAGVLGYGFVLGILQDFGLVFGICLEIYEALKIEIQAQLEHGC